MELVTGKDSAVAGLTADDEKLYCATRCSTDNYDQYDNHNHDNDDADDKC